MTVKLPWTCQGCFTSWEFVWWNFQYLDECPSCTVELEDRMEVLNLTTEGAKREK